MIEFAARIIAFTTDLEKSSAGDISHNRFYGLERPQRPIMPKLEELRVGQILFTSSELFRRS
jgi:hypothetical protein